MPSISTVGELIAALQQFHHEQPIDVRLFMKQPNFLGIKAVQLALQRVELFPPWNDAARDKSNWIVGIVAHEVNQELGPPVSDEEWTAELDRRDQVIADSAATIAAGGYFPPGYFGEDDSVQPE